MNSGKILNYVFKFAGFVLLAMAGHFIAFKLVHIPRQIETIIIIILLSFYPIVRNPEIGVYIVFVLIPFVPLIRRLYYLVYSRPAIDPFLAMQEIILFPVVLGIFFAIKDKWQSSHEIRRYMLIIFIYIAYMFSRTFIYNYKPFLESILSFKFYGPPALFFIVGIVFAPNRKLLKNLWIITVVIGLFGAIYGFKQVLFGYSEAEKIWLSSIDFSSLFIKGVARPFSIYKAPVAFADYMQLSIIGVMVLSLWSNSKKLKVAFLFVPVYFAACLITSVRSSWIGVAVSIVFWFIFFRLKNMTARIVTVVIIALLFLIINLSVDLFSAGMDTPGIYSVITKTLPGGENYVDLLITSRSDALYNPLKEHSMVSRLVLWKTLFQVTADPQNMFFGRGLGTLKADSIYFTYLAEFGYPGMIFIILLFIVFVRKSLKFMEITKDIDHFAISKGVAIMNIVFIIINITGSHIHNFPGSVYFWFWNGVIVSLYCGERKKEDSLLENINNT